MTPKPQSELDEALEISRSLVNHVYPSLPSYEMKLAHALLGLFEQYETVRAALWDLMAYAEYHEQRLPEGRWIPALLAAREALDSIPATGQEDT